MVASRILEDDEEDLDLELLAPPEAVEAPRRSVFERLAGENEIDRHEALLAILGEEQAEFLGRFPALAAAERIRLLAALWQQADVLLLEGRDRARPLLMLACSQADDPALRDAWRQLVGFYRPADPAAPLEPARAAAAVAEAPESLRRAFGRALLIHPNAEVRAVARAAVLPSDLWNTVVSPGTAPRILLEIWQSLRPRVAEDVLKIFLFAVAGRFLGEMTREQLTTAARLLVGMAQVGSFQERACRHGVLTIEKNLRAQAARHGLDLSDDAEFRHRLQSFAEAPIAPEQPILAWSQVPLPVQRTLARRGLFVRHFCTHQADAVALECFPHLMRRPDVLEFLKIVNINARLMAQLAEEKQLYESDSAKFFLLANPRCPFHIIGKYMGYLTSESLTKLSQGFLYNNFARKQAERLLEQRGKAKRPIPTKGKRRPT